MKKAGEWTGQNYQLSGWVRRNFILHEWQNICVLLSVDRVFANDLGDRVSIPGRVIPKT